MVELASKLGGERKARTDWAKERQPPRDPDNIEE